MSKKWIILLGIFIFLFGATLATYFFIPKKSVEIENSQEKFSEDEEKFIAGQEESLLASGEVSEEENSSVVGEKKSETSSEEVKEVQNASYPPVEEKICSWGWEEKADREVDTIIIHTSYDALHPDDPYSIEGIIEEFRPYGVAAHYIVGRDGRVVRTVREADVAYHAGVSKVPDGRTGVNYFSIGIEMVNDKESQLTDTQYEILNQLLEAFREKYEVKYILGHDEIAPDRKTDPWNFDWSRIER